MDNLKFQAVESQDSILITTETKTGKKFAGTITDFDVVQKPESILKEHVCKEKILQNMCNIMYTHTEEIITIRIPLLSECSLYAETELNLYDENSQIYETRLISKISEMLDPYEVIKVFSYPSWECFADFENNVNHRYFEVYKNWHKYMFQYHTDVRGTKTFYYYYISQFMNTHVTFHGWEKFDQVPKHLLMTGITTIFSDFHVIKDYEWKADMTETEKYRSVFSESCTKFTGVSKSGGLEISGKLLRYIKYCVVGWMLEKFQYVALADPKVHINIEKDSVTFSILRLRKRKFCRNWDNDYKLLQHRAIPMKTHKICQDPPIIRYLMPKISIELTVDGIDFQ